MCIYIYIDVVKRGLGGEVNPDERLSDVTDYRKIPSSTLILDPNGITESDQLGMKIEYSMEVLFVEIRQDDIVF